MRLTKSKILNQFGALLLLLNAYFFLVSQTAIPEDEPPNVELLVFDEDFLNKGLTLPDGSNPYLDIAAPPVNCDGNSDTNIDPDQCINEDIKGINIRDILFTRKVDITDRVPPVRITTTTGVLNINNVQNSDAGIFKFFKDDPQVSDQNGAEFTRCDFLNATGAAAFQANLDKIIEVKPLLPSEIFDLLDKESFCGIGIVSDANFTGLSKKTEGFKGLFTLSLQGATRGITAFKVVDVQRHPDGPPRLPIITFELIPSDQVDKVCERSCVPHILNKH